MDEQYKLSEEKHNAVYAILERRTLGNVSSVDYPRVVILGGQPGAGKSKLINMAVHALKPVPAIINGDDYRSAHPLAYEILRTNDKQYAEKTDPDVRLWTARLFNAAISKRCNIVFEGTMRNKEPLMSTIQYLHDVGYRIDIHVMAVKAEISRVGIVDRYESQKEFSGGGRWTPVESHDEAYLNLPSTVEALEQNSPIYSLKIYNHNGIALYTNMNGFKSISGRKSIFGVKSDAMAAILRVRKKPLTKDERLFLDHKRAEIIEKMQKRHATQEEISKVKTIIDFENGLS